MFLPGLYPRNVNINPPKMTVKNIDKVGAKKIQFLEILFLGVNTIIKLFCFRLNYLNLIPLTILHQLRIYFLWILYH